MAALPASENPYLSALQNGYAALAQTERDEFDWVDAALFAKRARDAAGGQAPLPLDPEAFNIDGETTALLQEARGELLGFLASEGAMLRAGRQIGDAQVQFDCWVQEAEEGHQTSDIDECREGYALLIVLVRDLGALPADIAVVLPEDGEIGGIELEQNGKRVTLDQAFAAAGTGKKLGDVPVTEGEIREAFAGALSARPKPPVAFTVTFAFNSTKIDEKAFLTIAKAAEEAISRPVAEVIVTGYADAPGSTGENQVLSRLRAERVRREVLRELGLQPADARRAGVTARARGERELAVETSAPDELNRRVVILVR